ncbi:esterase [Cellvibrio zantedeschiae]|uniref:Esterase n=1 Tax=Cellvibrio zantedeschiae TaxID=1237077 RepID=A0ABQ3B421_9GAMM|nr:alpha/beta hydrolase-fold protein [Cellvibrio zantedeschiae]GGY77366.1 esterase [Cellvibrio zantedeschiae]
MCKKFFLVFLMFFVGATSAWSETYKPFVLNNTQIVPIHSKFTGRDHELVVVLPSSYATNPNKKYPVLYYLDAYWDTPLLVSTYGNLTYDNVVPEFIMVGLSYPSSASYDKERRLDYTFTVAGEQSGKANLFLDFIQKEAAPLIEAKFRGDKKDRVLSGNSLGGLFTITAAYQAPNFFSGFIAISPAASWDNGALFKLDESYANQNKSLNGRMFISYGTTEYPSFRDPIIQFQKQIEARQYQGLELLNYSMEGLDHTSVKGDGYVRGLMWVWKTKKPAGPSGLERAITGAK